MTKAILTLEDDDATGEVLIKLDFDPPPATDTPMTHAYAMAFAALRHLRESYGQDKDQEDE